MNTLPDDNERALRELITVLQLEKRSRNATKADELAFIIANETHRIAPYEQAIFWSYNALGQIHIQAVSGVSHIDKDSPYFHSFVRVLKSLISLHSTSVLRAIAREDIAEQYLADWQEMGCIHPLWCPFVNAAGELQGGLWLNSREIWKRDQQTRLEFIIDAYAHSWINMTRSQVTWRKRYTNIINTMKHRKVKLAAYAFIGLIMLLPVSQTVTAPAEIVAVKPIIISPPVDGVVKEFHVRPNSNVKKGDLLFSLEDSVIRNRYEVATKALKVAQADYRRAIAKAFSDDRSKDEGNLLKAVVEQKSAEVNYTRELLQRIRIRAPADGIAVYGDENDWLGKPVSVGERIITLADPAVTELLVWVPVDDAIKLESKARVRGFLNVDPTDPLPAELRQLSYEAKLSPDNVLAFQLHAAFTEGVEAPRIGLKATAKVYGERVSLFYFIFRKPISALRRFLGW